MGDVEEAINLSSCGSSTLAVRECCDPLAVTLGWPLGQIDEHPSCGAFTNRVPVVLFTKEPRVMANVSYFWGLLQEHAFGHGVQASVYRVLLGRQVFALRRSRSRARDEHISLEKDNREIELWKAFCHPNVLQLVGVSLMGDRLCTVSPLMQCHARAYIHKHPEADVTKLVMDFAEGLSYLHALCLVHGDLKGANILISSTGTALISDFGSLHHRQDEAPELSWRATTRWTAPEMAEEESPRCGYMADIWCLGMSAWELYHDEDPFPDIKSYLMVPSAASRGHRPTNGRIRGLTDPIWQLLTECWHKDPFQRPNAVEYVDQLVNIKSAKDTRQDITDHGDSAEVVVQSSGRVISNGNSVVVAKCVDLDFIGSLLLSIVADGCIASR